MTEITLQDLLEAGVHFGHQTRRWNPKMKKYIFTERNGIYIIDLQKTVVLLNKACNVIREVAARGEPILFVGTKPQASSIVREEAERCGQFHVTNRWAGGMLTNYRTIRQSIKRLDHLETMSTDGTYEHLTKKEVLTLEKQRARLSFVLEGIRKMNRLPGLLIIVDTKKEKIAVNEARRLGIPICAIIDTNCDPDQITLPIPGNDDAIRSIKILLSVITDSVIEGIQIHTDEIGIAEKEETVQKTEEAGEEEEKYRYRVKHREEKTKVTTTEKKRTSAEEGEKEEREKKTEKKKSRTSSSRGTKRFKDKFSDKGSTKKSTSGKKATDKEEKKAAKEHISEKETESVETEK